MDKIYFVYYDMCLLFFIWFMIIYLLFNYYFIYYNICFTIIPFTVKYVYILNWLVA